jgi:cysteine-rich repeat protein
MLLQATSKPVCGNQILESGEECDDGTKNGTPGDNCSSACLLLKPNTQPVCGNNILESGEQCDHGAKNGTVGDNCNASCEMVKSTTLPVCGNNVLESGEQCDHGTKNGTTGDSCGADCKTVSAFQIPVCGNGIKETGEECDEGLKNGVENANCTESCTMAKPGVKTPEGQGVERQIRIVAHPEKRVNASQNWSTLSRVVFYNKTLHKTELETSIELNNTGWSGFDTDKLENGTYDISLKGYSHLTKVIRDVVIDQSTETIDFTEGGKSFLIAGDVHSSKDDFIDGLDIAATVNALYSNDLSADLNHDGFVNALDLSIVVGNIYKTGERIKI